MTCKIFEQAAVYPLSLLCFGLERLDATAAIILEQMRASRIRFPAPKTVRYLFTVLAVDAVFFPAASPSVAAEAVQWNPDGTRQIPVEILLTEIRKTPYSGSEGLRTKLKEAENRFADRLPEWEARKNALPEKQRLAVEAALKKLGARRELLRQKIDEIEAVSAEGWSTTRYNVFVAMLHATSTYKKLQYQLDH
jgi:hypothetical protein